MRLWKRRLHQAQIIVFSSRAHPDIFIVNVVTVEDEKLTIARAGKALRKTRYSQ